MISIGKNVKILGNVFFKLRGNPNNIKIMDDVIIGRNVDLRIRENGKIILNKGTYLDEEVRLVAAQKGMIDIGAGTSVGKGTIINSGGNFRTGQKCSIVSLTLLNIFQQRSTSLIREQYGNVRFGKNVWLDQCYCWNTSIEDGIVGANSLILLKSLVSFRRTCKTYQKKMYFFVRKLEILLNVKSSFKYIYQFKSFLIIKKFKVYEY